MKLQGHSLDQIAETPVQRKAEAQTSIDTASSRAFILTISVIGLAVFGVAFQRVLAAPLNAEWLMLTMVTLLLVSRIHLKIPRISTTATLSDTFIYVSVFLYGIWPAVLLAGADAFVCSICSRQHKNKLKVVPFNIAQTSLSIFLATQLVTLRFGDISVLMGDWNRLALVAGLLSLGHYLLNAGIVSAVNALRNGRDIIKSWREYFLWTSVTYFAGAAAACMVIKLITVISFYALMITVPILFITYLTYKNYIDKIQGSLDHVSEIADLHLRTIEALAIAIDAKDEVTHDHVHRVQVYATGLGRVFNLEDSQIEALKAGALLHDIGKLAVPDYILNKPGSLTPAEYEKMKTHTIVGADILTRVRFPYPVVPIVRHHHERWDGTGYPDGLKSEEIPVTARILSVVDCFDAVREDRQYRKAMSRAEAIALLIANSGTMYDPKIVEAFVEHLPMFEREIRERKLELQDGGLSVDRGPSEIEVLDGTSALQQIRSAHREVTALYGIAQSIGTSLDLRDTFAVFTDRLGDIVSYTSCVLYLQRSDSIVVEAVHASGAYADRFKGKVMTSGSGITGWVVANHQPMYNSDPRLDFDALKLEIDERYASSAVVPLQKDGALFGALALYSRDMWTYERDHIRIIEAAARLASDAIANALHHESTEVEALTDPMTGLPNARALRERFHEEITFARRLGATFSVLMMDLDGFKAVNDTLGHKAGDEVLKEVARLVARQVRVSDFLGRYAGDEFVAIVRTNPAEVPELIGRIQAEISSNPFRVGQHTVSVGMSVGWSCSGVDGQTLDELLIAADRAMYNDKLRRKGMVRPDAAVHAEEVSGPVM